MHFNDAHLTPSRPVMDPNRQMKSHAAMYLYGAGGHSKVILDILQGFGIRLKGIFDDQPADAKLRVMEVADGVRLLGRGWIDSDAATSAATWAGVPGPEPAHADVTIVATDVPTRTSATIGFVILGCIQALHGLDLTPNRRPALVAKSGRTR